MLALSLLLALPFAGDALANDAEWQLAERRFGQFHGMGELGDVTLDLVGLSLFDDRSSEDFLDPSRPGFALGATARDHCARESYFESVAEPRKVPRWALSEIRACRPRRHTLDRLIPRISIEGTFFSVGYGVTLDKESRGLYVDYGAFTFGIGDSPTGAAVFNGASFKLPRWVPGRDLLPDRIREDVELDVGIRLPLDTLNVRKWRPQVGIGITLAEW